MQKLKQTKQQFQCSSHKLFVQLVQIFGNCVQDNCYNLQRAGRSNSYIAIGESKATCTMSHADAQSSPYLRKRKCLSTSLMWKRGSKASCQYIFDTFINKWTNNLAHLSMVSPALALQVSPCHLRPHVHACLHKVSQASARSCLPAHCLACLHTVFQPQHGLAWLCTVSSGSVRSCLAVCLGMVTPAQECATTTCFQDCSSKRK